MSKKRTYTPEQKRELAIAWSEARSRGVSQLAFARDHGVSARRVREFAADHGPPAVPIASIRKVLVEAMTALNRALEQLTLVGESSSVAESALHHAIVIGSPTAVTGDDFADGSAAEETNIGEGRRSFWDLEMNKPA